MKYLHMFLIYILIFLSVTANEYIINNSNSDINISTIGNDISIDINKFRIEYEDQYFKIDYDNCTYDIQPGNPLIPVIDIFVQADSKDYISIEYGNKGIIDIKTGRMQFAYQSVFKTESNEEHIINSDVYNDNKLFPINDYNIIDCGYALGKRQFLVKIYPFRYNPVFNEIVYFSQWTVNVQDNGESLRNIMPEMYLIIMPQYFESSMQSFIEWKKREGFITKIMLTDTAGNNKDSIKVRIQHLYDNSPFDLSFALLVGDNSIIPNFTGTELHNPPTDLYYSLLEGSDYFPDIYVGRLSAEDSFSLDTIINKILEYEQMDWSGDDGWINRAYLMATNDASFHLLAEGTQDFAAKKLRTLPVVTDSLYYFYNSGTPVIDAVNNGRSMLFYTGHGTENSWSGPSLSQANVRNLTNYSNLPAVMSFACLTGNFAYSSECFGETWQRSGGGSAAFIGSSVLSLWYEDDIMERSMIKAIADSMYYTLGHLLEFAKRGVYAAYSGGGYSKRYYEMYNILGDPSMRLSWNIFGALNIETESILSDNADSLRIYVHSDYLPAANADISILKNDSLYLHAKTDINGYVSFNNIFSALDTLMLFAVLQNYRYDSMSVAVAEKAKNITADIIISDTIFSINGSNGRFSAGDNGTISLYAYNNGDDTLFNINAIILFKQHNIIQTDTMIFIADTLLPGDSVYSSESADFSVPDSIPYNSTETVEMNIIADTFSAQQIIIRPIESPFIEYMGFSFQDEQSYAQSGDSADVIISFKNTGNMTDRGIYIELVSLNPDFIIEPDSIYCSIILNDSTISDSFVFIISDSIDSFSVMRFNVNIMDTLNVIYSYSDSLFINMMDYLVIDYDNNHNSGPFIDSVLTSLGYDGNYKQTVKRNELYNYRNIFMCRGVYPNAVFLSAADSIANLLDTLLCDGKINMYMEGGECWFYDVSMSGFNFNGLFGLNGISDGLSLTGNISGLDNVIANSMNFTYIGDNSYLDFMEENGGISVFSNNGNIIGMYNRGSQYRTVGLSFELSGLNDSSAPSTRRQLLSNIMDFFNGITGVIDLEKENVPLKFQIRNMFEHMKTFELSGNEGDIVYIDIYDITGRKVFGSNHIMIKNNITVQYGGCDNSGNLLSSGVYFIRAYNSKEMLNSKMTIIH